MSKPHQRSSLGLERLESRSMLAGDLRCDHNAMLPEDTNGSGDVTAIDALVVINEIARSSRSKAVGSQSAGEARANMADVNADGKATAVDALVVINRIGRASRGGPAASRVPIEDRISRLAADIEAGTLPRNLDITTAKAILARLQSGKVPEVTDTPANEVEDDTVDGDSDNDPVDNSENDDVGVDDSGGSSADDPDETDDVDDDDNVNDNPDGDDSSDGDGDETQDDDPADDGTPDGDSTDDDPEDNDGGTHDCPDPADRLAHLADRLTERLTAAGVSTEVLSSVAASFSAAVGAGKPLTRADILKLLADAGVDATILEKLPLGGPDGEHHDPASAIDRLSEKLLENGNDPVVVGTLVAELKAAVDAGTPLTREEVKARIEALGLTLPTREERDPTNRFDRLAERLLSNGNDPKIVGDLLAELAAALDAGTPLSREEVKTRIEELGLKLPKPPEMPGSGQIVRRFHAIRDAYFASLGSR